MNVFSRHPVVVGTDGSEHATAAVLRAAWEADQRGVPLRIVHGYLVPVPYTAMGFASYPTDMAYPLESARTMLTEAVERVHRVYPALPVSTDIMAGSPAATLVEESHRASLIVVGSRGLGGFAGLLLGSVSAQVVAHSEAPVIIVKPDGSGATGAPPAGPVVVGVDGLPASDTTLAFGFEAAAARGVPLVVVYSWWILPPTNLGPIDLRHYDLEEAADEAHRMLAEVAAGWGTKYPDVPVELRPVHSFNPAEDLLNAGQSASLLVVGRHGGNVLSRLLFAAVGDTLARHAPCPVAIVPDSRT